MRLNDREVGAIVGLLDSTWRTSIYRADTSLRDVLDVLSSLLLIHSAILSESLM
jgi:hypothetical protein